MKPIKKFTHKRVTEGQISVLRRRAGKTRAKDQTCAPILPTTVRVIISMMSLKVSAAIQHAGSTPAASTKYQKVNGLVFGGSVKDSTGLIEGIGGIRQATTVTAQTIKAKTNVLTMPSRPAVNTRAMAMAA